METALDLADNAADADRIFLGAATYTAPAGGFKYYQAGGAVEIAGRGEGNTVLTAPSSDCVLYLYGSAGTSVHDLTIRLPQNAGAGMFGLITHNTARRTAVIEAPTQANQRIGVGLEYGGTLEDSRVALGGQFGVTGVELGNSGGTVRHSTLSAHTGVVSNQGGGTIERSRVTGTETAVAGYAGVTTIRSSLLRVSGAHGYGTLGLTRSGTHPILNADGATIVGPGGGPDTYGVDVGTEPAPAESVAVNLKNSIIRGFSAPVLADAAGSGNASVTASYSDYDWTRDIVQGPHAFIVGVNVSNVGNAGFVNAAGGDYHLLASWPLIDKGDPGTAQGLDLDGSPLVVDGNADGIARRDLGAFEHAAVSGGGGGAGGGGTGDGGSSGPDLVAPSVGGFRAVPSVFAVGRHGTPAVARVRHGTRFRFTLSEPARVTLKIKRALPGRRSHGRCVRPTASLVHARRCTRYRTVGTLMRSGLKGRTGSASPGGSAGGR